MHWENFQVPPKHFQMNNLSLCWLSHHHQPLCFGACRAKQEECRAAERRAAALKPRVTRADQATDTKAVQETVEKLVRLAVWLCSSLAPWIYNSPDGKLVHLAVCCIGPQQNLFVNWEASASGCVTLLLCCPTGILQLQQDTLQLTTMTTAWKSRPGGFDVHGIDCHEVSFLPSQRGFESRSPQYLEEGNLCRSLQPPASAMAQNEVWTKTQRKRQKQA